MKVAPVSPVTLCAFHTMNGSGDVLMCTKNTMENIFFGFRSLSNLTDNLYPRFHVPVNLFFWGFYVAASAFFQGDSIALRVLFRERDIHLRRVQRLAEVR